jgi:hypothetical protein
MVPSADGDVPDVPLVPPPEVPPAPLVEPLVEPLVGPLVEPPFEPGESAPPCDPAAPCALVSAPCGPDAAPVVVP